MPSVCVEDGLRLDIHRMVAAEFARGATRFFGTWAWWRNGERRGTIDYTVEREGKERARMTLRYANDGEAMEYAFSLVGEPCRFGGLRWFAICPRTWLKVAKLYMPPGAKHFWARKAWRMAYRSQNVSAGFERLCNQRDRLLFQKLKSDDPELPLKPKRMRWKTYHAHLAKLDCLHMGMDAAIRQRFGAILGANFF